MKKPKKIYEYRMAVPVSLCVTVKATGPKAARAEVKRILTGSGIEEGIDVESCDFNTGVRDIDPDGRIYANDPFDGITVEDESEYVPSDE